MGRDRAYLLDILEAAKLAVSYVEGMTPGQFLRDVQCQDSVIRRLEIIGEAARRISIETRTDYPGIPWSTIVGMRNFLIHEYDDVDLGVVWRTVRSDLPPLIALIEPLVPPEGGAPDPPREA